MNFVYVGNFKQVRSTEEYVALALEANGHYVNRIQESDYTPDEALVKIRRELDRPSVFLFSKCELMGIPFRSMALNPEPLEEFLLRVGNIPGITAVATWVFDLMRKEFQPKRHHWASKVSHVCDAFITTDAGLSDDPAIYNHFLLRQGYPGPVGVDRGEPRSGMECWVAHIGEVYGGRRQWARELQRVFDYRFRVFEDVFCDRLFDLCKSAKIILGPPYPYYPGYWSNRIYLATGYGGCFACPTVEGMREDGWIPGVDYIETLLEPKAYAERLKECLKPEYDKTREVIRHNGQCLAQRKLTYRHRCEELVRILEGVT